MQVKKYLAVFSLMMIMCLSVLPSFVGAESKMISKDKLFYSDFEFRSLVNGSEKISDDWKSTSFTISNYSNPYFMDLGGNYNVDSFYINARNGSASAGDFKFSFYDFNKKRIYSSPTFGVPYLSSSLPNKEFSGNISVKSVRYVSIEGSVNLFEFQVFGGEYVPQILDLNYKESVNSIDFNWKNPDDKSFNGVKILKDGEKIDIVDKDVNSYHFTGLESDKIYNFKFITLYGDKEAPVIEKNVRTLVDPKTIPPSPVSSLTAEPTDKTVKLKWKSPKDDDLAGFKILQNGKQVAEIGLEEEFTVKNLQPLTDYNFGVMAVDKDKNDSTPVNLSVKTLDEKDDEPPHVPSNVFAKPSNGALIASWDKVSDKDLAGYNVYLDGKKINSNLISSTNFSIKNLENNRKYKVQVQAVDRSGNASQLSLAAFGTPDTNTIPIIESKYSLQDVSDGVGVMFSQLWLVLAFAVGIPLAFYIIYKLKHTVLP